MLELYKFLEFSRHNIINLIFLKILTILNFSLTLLHNNITNFTLSEFHQGKYACTLS